MNEARYREAERRLWASLGVAPTERRLQLSRFGTTVRVQELGDGPAVLFIHGASNNGTSWADLVARLPTFRCLLLDRPGTGLSEPLRQPITDIDAMVALGDDLVADVLDALALEQADVASNSFGGYFAFRGALARPERVRRIIEFGWLAGAPHARLPMLMRIATTPSVGALLARLPANERMVRSMFRSIGLGGALDAGRVSDEAIAAYVALLRDTDTMRHEVDLGRWLSSPIRGVDPRLLLTDDERTRITQPVQLLWGEDDPFGGAEIARDFVRPIPNAQLEVMPGTGHAVWMDDPGHAAAVTERFLSD